LRHLKFLLKSTSLRFDVFRLPRSIKERKFLDPFQLPPSKLLNSKINNTEKTATTLRSIKITPKWSLLHWQLLCLLEPQLFRVLPKLPWYPNVKLSINRIHLYTSQQERCCEPFNLTLCILINSFSGTPRCRPPNRALRTSSRLQPRRIPEQHFGPLGISQPVQSSYRSDHFRWYRYTYAYSCR